jgi:tRNA1(Val) A37 N6-methylase TrmN6
VAQPIKTLAEDAWFEPFGELYRQNGYFSRPSGIYAGFLPFIRRSGRILELGCGNGMLLRYLSERSENRLTPFGIDIDPCAIETARTVILPDFADNFRVGDVRDYHEERNFDIVVTNPVFANSGFYEQQDGCIQTLYPDGSIRTYLEKCLSLLSPHGDLVLYSYEEEHERIPNFARVFALESEGLEFKRAHSSRGRTAYWLLEGAGLL